MPRYEIFRLGILLSAMFLMNLVYPNSSLAEEKPQKSLYERLGGVYNIAPVVDEFLEGLCWSTTVIMKIDLVGPQRRGLRWGSTSSPGTSLLP